MSQKLLLWIAAFLVLIHLLGHTMGHMGWDKPEDAGMQQVVTAMKSHSAEFMGATKSMADYYSGYSLLMFGLYGMTILILVILATATAENRKLVNALLVPMGIAYVYFGVVEFDHFFPFAAIISLLSGVCMLIASRIKVKEARQL